MAVPETQARQKIKTLVEAEFAGITVEDGKLLRAAGRDGRTRVATSPNSADEVPRQVNELEVQVLLQYNLPFEDEPNEDYIVDPTAIEAIGDRLRRKFGPNSSGITADQWFIRLRRIRYPDDPTGNKTRLEADISAWCENPASIR